MPDRTEAQAGRCCGKLAVVELRGEALSAELSFIGASSPHIQVAAVNTPVQSKSYTHCLASSCDLEAQRQILWQGSQKPSQKVCVFSVSSFSLSLTPQTYEKQSL